MPIERGVQLFPKSEYLRRLSAVKSEMATRAVDTLILANSANITYLTGYTARSAYVPQGLVISINEDEPTFVLRRMDAAAAVHLTHLDRENIVAYPESYVGKSEKDGWDAIIDFLHKRGLATGKMGLELGQLATRSAEKFKERLPEAKIVDCTHAVTWIRALKSDLEIEVMKEAGAISDAAIQRAAEVIKPGVREADAIAEIAATLARGANGKPGTLITNSLFLCTSPRTGTCHITWTEDVFQQGSQVNLELGGVRHGYTAPIMRTFSIGKPSDRLRRLHEAEIAGFEAALDKLRPGYTCSDVAEAFYSTIQRYGFEKESRCGYAVGIDWTEPIASLAVGDMTELKPNMTFHLMLGNWIDEDFGYVLGDTVRVAETGGETLTNAPRKIFEI